MRTHTHRRARAHACSRLLACLLAFASMSRSFALLVPLDSCCASSVPSLLIPPPVAHTLLADANRGAHHNERGSCSSQAFQGAILSAVRRGSRCGTILAARCSPQLCAPPALRPHYVHPVADRAHPSRCTDHEDTDWTSAENGLIQRKNALIRRKTELLERSRSDVQARATKGC